MPTIRVAVHAKPGAKRAAVGGLHGGALVVAVTARAVDGAATEAIIKTLCDALGVKRRQAVLASGATSRAKIIDIEVDSEADVQRVRATLAGLRGER